MSSSSAMSPLPAMSGSLFVGPRAVPVRLRPPSVRRQRAVLRRRRLVVAVTALLLCAGVAVGLHRLATAALAPEADPAAGLRGGSVAASVAEPATVVVQPGDSLWVVARRLQPRGDVRPLVDHLAELNGGGALEVGQVLVVPAR